MTTKSSVERFMEIRGQHMHPRNRMRILYGIAFSLTSSELVELRERVGERLQHFKEIDAPAVIITNQEVLDKQIYALLDKVRGHQLVGEKEGSPPTETTVPSKPKTPSSDKGAVKEPVPVGVGDEEKLKGGSTCLS